jgi:hypothetical protein
MNEIKLCAYCNFANPLTATVCVRCGTPLVPLLTARLTPTVPNFSTQVIPPDFKQFEKLVAPETLLFVVAGSSITIPVKKSSHITLGREFTSENSAQVNLSTYNAFFLGVSRQHAVIELSGPNYFIRDLESTNGTWLNERKLIPHDAYALHVGDLIRLGQMGLYIYFMVPELPPNDLIITDMFTTITLTPEYLVTKIGSYLMLLAGINSIIDTMMERTQFVVTIRSINAEPDAKQIRLQGQFNELLLNFLENDVIQWKRQHASEIRKIWELEHEPIRLDLGPQDDPISPGYNQARDQIQAPLTQLVKQFMGDAAPDLAKVDEAMYFDKLYPLMYQLVRNSLQVKREKIPEAHM